VRHVTTISAANFSISTLVLQKQHSFKNIKDNFLKCTNTKIRSKPFYTQILSNDTYCNIAERNLYLWQIFSLNYSENNEIFVGGGGCFLAAPCRFDCPY